MKKIIVPSLIFTIITTTLFTSCQKELSCDDCRESNKPPVALAGADQTIILPKDSVVLDGSSSTDADGTIKSYKWIRVSGPSSSVIAKPDAPVTSVTSLIMGVYKFELTVTDNRGLSAKDTVQIIVGNPAINQPPIANAGPDQSITLPINTITIDGNRSTDKENNITRYSWVKISGPSSFNIVNPTTSQTQVVDLVQGIYQFELQVTDAGNLTDKDTVQIIVNAPGPITELIIPDLVWSLFQTTNAPGIWDEIYIILPDTSNKFWHLPSAQLSVFVKPDSSNSWVPVHKLTANGGCSCLLVCPATGFLTC